MKPYDPHKFSWREAFNSRIGFVVIVMVLSPIAYGLAEVLRLIGQFLGLW